MRWRHVVIFALAAFAVWVPAGPCLAESQSQAKETLQLTGGRVIVKYRYGTSAAAVQAASAKTGAQVIDRIRTFGIDKTGSYYVAASDDLSNDELVKMYEADPDVLYAEPDQVIKADAVTYPNDPSFLNCWGLTKLNAPLAWGISTGNAGVVVADLDTGVQYTHPDLAANMWHNPGEIAGNHVDDDSNGYIDDVYGIDKAYNDTDPWDGNGHGTHTSGTIAAVGNNAAGVTGICWTAQIMALQFMNNAGTGYSSGAITCINYAIWEKQFRGVNVVAINASWGGSAFEQSLHDAIAGANAAGIVFVCSAGNGGADGIGDNNDVTPQYPACYDCPNILSVASTDSTDALASSSNYGVATVDIAAPGVNVLSTYLSNGYTYASGTSMAAPHVTGAITLLAAAYPADTVATRMGRVTGTCDPLATCLGKVATGGRLNLARALDRTPPVTTMGALAGGWTKKDVSILLVAADDNLVAGTQYSFNGGAWAPYAGPVVISTQGQTVFGYFSTDACGNAEAPQYLTVMIDKERPTTRALKNAFAVQNKAARFRFRVNDVTPRARVRIRIYGHGRLKETINCGNVRTGKALVETWKHCWLPRGTYTWKVLATDQAGNKARSIGSKQLFVR